MRTFASECSVAIQPPMPLSRPLEGLAGLGDQFVWSLATFSSHSASGYIEKIS